MRLTSPPLSVVSIAGIMLLLLLVIFLGIDEGVTSSEVHNVFCVLNLWIGVVAFTLVYGAVLTKAFRVYYIFTNIKFSKEKQTKVRFSVDITLNDTQFTAACSQLQVSYIRVDWCTCTLINECEECVFDY